MGLAIPSVYQRKDLVYSHRIERTHFIHCYSPTSLLSPGRKVISVPSGCEKHDHGLAVFVAELWESRYTINQSDWLEESIHTRVFFPALLQFHISSSFFRCRQFLLVRPVFSVLDFCANPPRRQPNQRHRIPKKSLSILCTRYLLLLIYIAVVKF